jgi:pimeloyl-ACP methyl ester carboxylesterase
MGNMPQICYFHGLPGSANELALFGHAHPNAFSEIFVPLRDDSCPDGNIDSYLDAIALQIAERFPHGTIRLIGFSLGACLALQIAERLEKRVEKIDLLSAAAPLCLGDFLDDMAGKAVFQTARTSTTLFSLLVKIQSWAARWMPSLLVKAVFANAAGQDRQLANNSAFQNSMAMIIGQSLGQNANTYRREIAFYVTDWSATLPNVTQPITLWQGEMDNWTPPAMADALQKGLSNVVARHNLKGLSHYSTLRHFLKNVDSIPAS